MYISGSLCLCCCRGGIRVQLEGETWSSLPQQPATAEHHINSHWFDSHIYLTYFSLRSCFSFESQHNRSRINYHCRSACVLLKGYRLQKENLGFCCTESQETLDWQNTSHFSKVISLPLQCRQQPAGCPGLTQRGCSCDECTAVSLWGAAALMSGLKCKSYVH